MFKKHLKETNADISVLFFRATTNYKMPHKDRVLKEKEKAKKNAAKGMKSIADMFFKSLSPNPLLLVTCPHPNKGNLLQRIVYVAFFLKNLFA